MHMRLNGSKQTKYTYTPAPSRSNSGEQLQAANMPRSGERDRAEARKRISFAEHPFTKAYLDGIRQRRISTPGNLDTACGKICGFFSVIASTLKLRINLKEEWLRYEQYQRQQGTQSTDLGNGLVALFAKLDASGTDGLLDKICNTVTRQRNRRAYIEIINRLYTLGLSPVQINLEPLKLPGRPAKGYFNQKPRGAASGLDRAPGPEAPSHLEDDSRGKPPTRLARKKQGHTTLPKSFTVSDAELGSANFLLTPPKREQKVSNATVQPHYDVIPEAEALEFKKELALFDDLQESSLIPDRESYSAPAKRRMELPLGDRASFCLSRDLFLAALKSITKVGLSSILDLKLAGISFRDRRISFERLDDSQEPLKTSQMSTFQARSLLKYFQTGLKEPCIRKIWVDSQGNLRGDAPVLLSTDGGPMLVLDALHEESVDLEAARVGRRPALEEYRHILPPMKKAMTVVWRAFGLKAVREATQLCQVVRRDASIFLSLRSYPEQPEVSPVFAAAIESFSSLLAASPNYANLRMNAEWKLFLAPDGGSILGP